MHNLINDESLEPVKRRLIARMWEYVRETGDTIDNAYPPVGLVPVGPHRSLWKQESWRH